MTIEDLNKLTNEEINRIVAERVMGWEVQKVLHHHVYVVTEWTPKCKWSDSRQIDSGDWSPSTDYNDSGAGACGDRAAKTR